MHNDCTCTYKIKVYPCPLFFSHQKVSLFKAGTNSSNGEGFMKIIRRLWCWEDNVNFGNIVAREALMSKLCYK